MASEPSPAARWVAHHPIAVRLVVLVAAACSGGLSGVDAAGSLPLALAMVVTEWCSWRHETRPCIGCATAIPADPAAAAVSWHGWLWWRHRADSSAVNLAVSAVVLVMMLFAPRPWLIVVVSIAWMWWGVCAVAQRKHSAVALWCPWCRRGDGGDGDRDEVPDPQPSGEKSR